MYVKIQELIMTAQIENEKKKHYWLASVTITFEHEGKPLDTNVNALVNNTQNYVTKTMLGNAQVQSQIQLSKSLGDQLPDVKHVYIQSLSYLGYMSETEFHDTETDNE